VNLFKKVQVKVAPFIAYLIVKLINITLKKNYHNNQAIPKQPFILSFWHGELLFTPIAYFGATSLPISGMISEHRDGETITKTMEYLGVGAIRGSSSKGGVKALLNAIKAYKSGVCVAITPDGPRGPRHSIAPGIIMLAQKLDAKIVSLTIKPTKYWQFNSWDKFFIPKPFSTIDFYFSDPFWVTNLNEEEAKELIKSKMMEYVAF